MRLTGTFASLLTGAVAVLVSLFLAGRTWAHFQSDFNLRVVHFEYTADGMTAYFRINLPLVVAKSLGPRRADGSFSPASYTTNRIESGQVFHYLDVSAVRRDVLGLARMLADGHAVFVGGRRLAPVVLSARVHPKGKVPPFNTLAEARSATTGAAYPKGPQSIEIGYVLVDVRVFYRSTGGVERFELASTLRPGELGRRRIVNLLVDHSGPKPTIYRFDGPMERPVTINPSLASAVSAFVAQGVRHILGGKDHLLFVLCLTIAAGTLGGLAWRITGFTLGHTVSLVGGFLGLAPGGAWFIPMVEVAIALSIVYAAAAVFLPQPVKWSLAVTTLIGLLHGLGFSFALRGLLDVEGPNLVTSLASFNIGVEVGQLALILAVWPGLVLLGRWQAGALSAARRWAAAGSIVIAAVWAFERVGLVWQAV